MSNHNQTDQTLQERILEAINSESDIFINGKIEVIETTHCKILAKLCTAISLSFAIETLENIGWPTLWSEIQKLKEQLKLINQG